MKKQKCWYLIQTWSDKAFKGTVVNRALPSLYGGLFEICYSPFNIQGLDTISSIRFNKIESLDTVSSIRFNIQGFDTVSSIRFNIQGLNRVSSIRFNIQGLDTVSTIRFNIQGLDTVSSIRFNIQGLDTVSSIRFNIQGSDTVSCIRFNIQGLDTVSSIRFNIQGLDTVSSIWLNNEKVGTSNNMFVRYIYPIKELLKPGNHFSFFSYFNFFFVPQIHLSKMLSYFIFHCFYKLLEQNHLLFILNLCWFTNYLLSYNSFFHSHISQTFVI